MLTLKAGTPRRPAREELRLWKAVLPSFPADTRGADVTHVAALGVVSPRLFLQPLGFQPRVLKA